MRFVLDLASSGQTEGNLVRPLTTLVSHASLVFDEKVFMKCYRVLERGPRPEVEVLFGLDEAGFNALAAPLGRWREGDFDLALVREFLPSALEGRLLALTSLRDLLAHASFGEEADGEFSGGVDVEDAERAAASAGGDFASEMRRLGETTARLHVALASAFGRRPLTAAALPPSLDHSGSLALGEEIQLHGDFHLRRVMRGETGWLVTGFGDDPLYNESGGAPSSTVRRGSCLEDIADMTFALRRVSLEALAQRPEGEAPLASALAAAWTSRNRGAFLAGYLADEGVNSLLPPDQRFRDQLLYACEQVREKRYEATSAGA
jgi:maltokinase